MKKFVFFVALLGLLFTVSSCKNEFEKIRTSGDSTLILKKANEYFVKKDFAKAQSLYELVIGSIKGKEGAEKVYYNYAYTHYNLNKFTLASYYFKQFSTTYPNSQYKEEVDYMAAYCNYRQSPSYRLDQSSSEKAIEELQLFLNTYPNSQRAEECNKLITQMRAKLEQKAYAQGELYYNILQYQSSVQVLDNLLKDFPETENAEKIRYTIAKAYYKWASNSVLDKQEERYKNMIENGEEFVKKHKSSKYSKEIQLYIKDSKSKLKEINNERYQNKSARS